MSSYDEYLISQAGGDGDILDQIQRRINDCQSYKFGMFNADKLAHEDAPYLLALVREQAAKLEAVRALCSDWDAVVDVFPLTPAALFAGSHAKRVREALEQKP